MKKYQILYFSAFFLFLVSCHATKKTADNDGEEIIEVVTFEERDLDTLFVVAPRKFNTNRYKLPTYNPSSKREHDLLHTKLDVKFDWLKQHVLGQATLQLSPYFFESDQLLLDAKGFEVRRVGLINGQDTVKLKYFNNKEQLLITLDRTYKKSENYWIYIDYTAKPAERMLSGSAAISSDQGLYFINHDGKTTGKPQQIWTQGETEANSAWFPTIDKPNERCTQEMYITVQNKFKTLSNGLLKSSKTNNNGTRTDHWLMDLPHAPYLFMLTVGDFAVVKDEWKGKEVSYYVEPAYEAHARAIFAHTKEMLTFFSEKLGVDYPWQKYAQIVVRDYVSGAMENTTGVIFGDFVQRTTRELIDNNNDKIVAHELMHHWFGDLVTCESWSNLTLNEGFANYGEYLWLEHKYGKDVADHHLQEELRGYLYTSESDFHDLINFKYNDREDMFDAHSYNKGGCVLHHLRGYLGDEAFFAGLNLYLKNNKFTAVEAHDLRLAFEEVTGEDLNWFFNQWYFSLGHPELEVEYGYDTTDRRATITVEQLQNPAKYPAIFILPLEVDIYSENGKTTEKIFVTKRKETFYFKSKIAPKLMVLDAKHTLLGTITTNKTTEDYLFQLENAKPYLDRYNAITAIATKKTPAAEAATKTALVDENWVIRSHAINNVVLDETTLNQLRKLMSHPHSNTRIASINRLRRAGDSTIVPMLEASLMGNQEPAYNVISAQLLALKTLAPQKAVVVAEQLINETYGQTVFTLAEILASTKDVKYLPFFYAHIENIDGYYASSFYELHSQLLEKGDDKTIGLHSEKLFTVAETNDYSWKRYNAAKVIYNAAEMLRKRGGSDDLLLSLDKKIAEIKASEPNKKIQNLYRGW
jgi:aminopeptidase N